MYSGSTPFPALATPAVHAARRMLRHGPGVVLALLLAALEAGAGAGAEDAPRLGAGPLDGMIFVGEIGPADSPDFAEELHFNQGLMWSKMCMRCGFQPAPYWTRRVGDAIHVIGELTGASGSVFRYDGMIEGDRAEVTVRWTKARWYWRIDRTLVFRGTRAADQVAMPGPEASRAAAEALSAPLPEWCP